jgi:transposase-like protein
MAENRSMADGSTGGRTRRRWSVARKAAILAELGEPGVTLSVVARRHAIAPSLLHRWRSGAMGVKGRRIFPSRGRSDFPTRLRRVVVV